MSGKVYLVGAGCGAHDLITVRGLHILKRADAVVYDALIDVKLLDFAPDAAERIPVGKRAGQHSETQTRICEILVEQSQKHRTIVRLKGGDPFVFGRGGEEVLALQAADIPFEVIPGISSCIAAAELAGIPVTHRDTARSFHVITAHASHGRRELEQYAKLEGTLVFLMGLTNLRGMMRDLVNAGMPLDTPAAVISRGGTPQQKAVRGCIRDIADRAEAATLEAPAVILVGKTAGMTLLDQTEKPLSGVRVALTGTPHFTDQLAALLSADGAAVEIVCRMEVVPLPWELPALSEFHWLVLTSPNAVHELLSKLKETHTDLRRLPPKIAVLGAGTAAALERLGLYPDLIPEIYTSEALGNALIRTVLPGERLLLLRARQGSAILPDLLIGAGIPFTETAIYDVQDASPAAHTDADYLVFASASGVHGFFGDGGTVGAKTKLLCIGSVTAQALTTYQITPDRIAAVQTAEGIRRAILEDHHAQISTAAHK